MNEGTTWQPQAIVMVISSFLPALHCFRKQNYLYNVSPKVLRQFGNGWDEEESWRKDSFLVNKFGDGGGS